jgi:hypothetical protein
MDESYIISSYLTFEQALELLHDLLRSNGQIQEVEVLHRGGPRSEIRGFVSDEFEPIQDVFDICREVVQEELLLGPGEDVKFCITYRLPE